MTFRLLKKSIFTKLVPYPVTSLIDPRLNLSGDQVHFVQSNCFNADRPENTNRRSRRHAPHRGNELFQNAREIDHAQVPTTARQRYTQLLRRVRLQASLRQLAQNRIRKLPATSRIKVSATIVTASTPSTIKYGSKVFTSRR
jgi:hypothetical protein